VAELGHDRLKKERKPVTCLGLHQCLYCFCVMHNGGLVLIMLYHLNGLYGVK
jgi:hypothetical protein